MIGHLSPLGFSAIFYYNSGALLVCIINFVVSSRGKSDPKRVLIWGGDNKVDFSLVMCYVGGALFGTSIFLAINTIFYFCGKAGLNIGIA